jgi:hypothetical protein
MRCPPPARRCASRCNWAERTTSSITRGSTLQLDADVLAAARVLARQQRTPLGAVISALSRQALVAPPPASSSDNRMSDHRNCQGVAGGRDALWLIDG